MRNSTLTSGAFLSFTGVDGIQLKYASFCQPTHTKCLIICTGRSESYLKYEELISELFQQGFDIFILDHRGQGLSERMLNNPHKGYVKNFDDYAADLNTFVNTIVEPYSLTKQQSIYLLAHSMGSTIALRYFQLYQHPIKAAVLSSPMITFSRKGLPLFLVESIINITQAINNRCSKTPWYFIGQGDYKAIPFANNPLSHSPNRYQAFINLYENTPEIQLGGVTIKWLQEALKVYKKLFKEVDKLNIPIQVLQAGADRVIDNEAQNQFCQRLHQHYPASCPNGRPIVIDGAKHELFIEADCYRQPAITTALNWFTQH